MDDRAITSSWLRRKVQFELPVVFALVLAVWMSVGGATARAQATLPCARLASFSPQNFAQTPVVDSSLMPLTPGSQRILDGMSNVTGQPLPHRVTFTVTDLTKVIDGVRNVVVYDVDYTNGQLLEAELSFFAQDNSGNVWNLGEYPEEYVGGAFSGAPFTWIAGAEGAEAGIHVPVPTPAVGAPVYLQGYAPAISFLDCAQTFAVDQTTTVPAGTFTGVVVTDETSPLDPAGGSQRKHYAPGVGIVEVAAVNDPQGETLVLSGAPQLDANALAQIRSAALALDSHGYEVSPGVYGTTSPAEPPPPPPPAQPPPSEPSPSGAAVQSAQASPGPPASPQQATAVAGNKIVAAALSVSLDRVSQRLSKGYVRVGVRCHGDVARRCRGRADVFTRGTRHRLGGAVYVVRAGARQIVELRLTAAGRRLVRRAGRLKVVIRSTGADKADRGLNTTMNLTLVSP